MSEIAPINRPGRVDPMTPVRAVDRLAAAMPARGSDEVFVSPMATYLNKLRENPIREELVNEVREQIADGTYETPEKIDAAVSELAQEL
jgi:anti-sigma28 factor (negative regulator of flagellin synthesis)